MTSRWWGRRWLQTVQKLGCVEKISRGKNYAKGGHVLSHGFAPGAATAQVQGSRWPPYEGRFAVDPLEALQWRRVLASIAERPLFAARLLAGEVPPDLEGVFSDLGLSLLPHGEVSASCTCPSDEESCKHMAAACYVFAEALDNDPFQLFTLRGRTRAQLLTALGSGEQAARVQLPSDPAEFWRAAPPPRIALDPAPHPVIARLGDPGELSNFAAFLQPAYDAISRRASAIVGEL